MTPLEKIAPAFVDMAHRIVWTTVATVTPSGKPSTRILHPIWEWDGSTLTGWIATDPTSPKGKHLEATPEVSLTYWDATHDTCTARCRTTWENSDEQRQAGWDRFANTPEPLGYDPRIIPRWTSPTVPEFGILRLEPIALRVMPGSLMLKGEGELLTWKA